MCVATLWKAFMASRSVYTDPLLRQRLYEGVLRGNKGGAPMQWSARKAQLLARLYTKEGGGYRGAPTARQRSLSRWTRQRWRTRSGAPSTQGPLATGERYLPEAAIHQLTPGQYAATSSKKRKGTAAGQQFVPNTAAAAQASRRARGRGAGRSRSQSTRSRSKSRSRSQRSKARRGTH